jgi:hypothetical protein
MWVSSFGHGETVTTNDIEMGFKSGVETLYLSSDSGERGACKTTHTCGTDNGVELVMLSINQFNTGSGESFDPRRNELDL